jgi:hypothetical protein
MLFGIHQARHAIRQSGIAVLVEGNFDVVSLHARGITNVVAPLTRRLASSWRPKSQRPCESVEPSTSRK